MRHVLRLLPIVAAGKTAEIIFSVIEDLFT